MSFFSILWGQIVFLFPYWILGIFIGSAVSVFVKDKIHNFFIKFQNKKWDIIGLFIASICGILSPVCMYGTIPIIASFAEKGIREDFLAAFMVSSILLNPQLIIYTTALGYEIVLLRIFSCLICGILAGLFIQLFFKNKNFFNFSNFQSQKSKKIKQPTLITYLKDIVKNIKITGTYFFIGIFLASIFTKYFPTNILIDYLGKNTQFNIIIAILASIPLYICGGGTIPILATWIHSGMSNGSVIAFMTTGASTKITNLSAVKIILGIKHLLFYLLFILSYSFILGFMIDSIK